VRRGNGGFMRYPSTPQPRTVFGTESLRPVIHFATLGTFVHGDFFLSFSFFFGLANEQYPTIHYKIKLILNGFIFHVLIYFERHEVLILRFSRM
jgi:hypothetical protein